MVASVALISGNGHGSLYSPLSSLKILFAQGHTIFKAKHLLNIPVSPGTSGSPATVSFLYF